MEEKRLAHIGIIVEDRSSAARLNALLGDYGDHIIGRMGLPVQERGVNVISVVMDAPLDVVNALTGKLGSLENVSAKTLLAKV